MKEIDEEKKQNKKDLSKKKEDIEKDAKVVSENLSKAKAKINEAIQPAKPMIDEMQKVPEAMQNSSNMWTNPTGSSRGSNEPEEIQRKKNEIQMYRENAEADYRNGNASHAQYWIDSAEQAEKELAALYKQYGLDPNASSTGGANIPDDIMYEIQLHIDTINAEKDRITELVLAR